jgi:hypothetical protein
MNLYTSSAESLSLLRAVPRRNTRGLCSQGKPALVGYWKKSFYFAFCCFYGINLGKKLWHSSRASTFLPRVRIDSRAIHFFHLIERRAGSFFS